MRKYRATLSVEVEVEISEEAPVQAEDLRKQFRGYAEDWNDGRYLFSVEVLADAAQKISERVVQRTLLYAADMRDISECKDHDRAIKVWGKDLHVRVVTNDQVFTASVQEITQSNGMYTSEQLWEACFNYLPYLRVIKESSPEQIWLPEALKDAAVQIFLNGLNYDYNEDTRMIRKALNNLRETGSISGE